MKSLVIACLAASLCGAVPAIAATVSTFDTPGPFLAAASPETGFALRAVETFDDGSVDGLVSEVFPSGATSPARPTATPFFSVSTSFGGIAAIPDPGNPVWLDLVTATDPLFVTIWSVARPVIAWGGLFDTSTPTGTLGLGWTLFDGATALATVTFETDASGFAGLVSTHEFDSVLISAFDASGTSPDSGERGIPRDRVTYRLDNMIAQTAPVPLPAAILLLISGLGGLAVFARGRTARPGLS